MQPYLVLFFVFYVGIAILYARRGPLDAKAPVDGVLVFGVPIVGFALQMAIVRSHRYGVAWSAGALAAVYGLLWLLLRTARRRGPGAAREVASPRSPSSSRRSRFPSPSIRA